MANRLLFFKNGLAFKVVEAPLIPVNTVEPRPRLFGANNLIAAAIGALVGLSILAVKVISTGRFVRRLREKQEGGPPRLTKPT